MPAYTWHANREHTKLFCIVANKPSVAFKALAKFCKDNSIDADYVSAVVTYVDGDEFYINFYYTEEYFEELR